MLRRRSSPRASTVLDSSHGIAHRMSSLANHPGTHAPHLPTSVNRASPAKTTTVSPATNPSRPKPSPAGKTKASSATPRSPRPPRIRFASLAWLWPKPFPGTEKIVQEDAETKVIRDATGRLARFWKHKSGTPEHLGFECETRNIWETKIQARVSRHRPPDRPRPVVRSYKFAREKGRWSHVQILRRVRADPRS